MKITKEQITTGWSFRRVLSILFGGIILYKAAITQEVVSAIFGLALVGMVTECWLRWRLLRWELQ